MEYMFLFFTHSGAIKFDRKCKRLGITCSLMPVPRVLSSNCSISARVETDMNIKDLIDTEVEGIYSAKSGDYTLLYESD
jgi:hypothetical protein